jgi:hypothetical protein
LFNSDTIDGVPVMAINNAGNLNELRKRVHDTLLPAVRDRSRISLL